MKQFCFALEPARDFFKLILLALVISGITFAETPVSILKARDLYARLTGVRPSSQNQTVIRMAQLIESDDTRSAAALATNSIDFYNVNLYQFFSPKSNRAEVKDVPLNDFIAMGIANTAVNRPYTDLLSRNFTIEYKGLTNAQTEAVAFTLPTDNVRSAIPFDRIGTNGDNRVIGRQIVPNRIVNGAEVEGNLRIARTAEGTDLPQRNNIPAAGVLTSEKFLAEHAIMGTNRRLVVYTFKDFLCKDIQEWRDGDSRISDHHVTKDIPRNPGGSFLAYYGECRTCHQVMDPLRKAFSGFDFTGNTPDDPRGRVTYSTAGAAKLLRQNGDTDRANNRPPSNPRGAFLGDNGGVEAWENYSIYNTSGSYFGWQGPLSGTGVTSFGEMVARADAFRSCAVTQVWDQICKTSLSGREGDRLKRDIGDEFAASNFNLRRLYAGVALNPLCNGNLYVASGSGSAEVIPPSAGTPPAQPVGMITFNIPAGTGNGAWNTAASPLVVSMAGQTSRTVRITNLDSVPKVLHSSIGNGFCPHQNIAAPLQTGQSYDCVIQATAVNRETCANAANPVTYDHNAGTGARFCIRVTQ